MSLENSTVTKYAIARGQSLISDGYDDIDTAQRQFSHLEENARSLGIEPDFRVVTVEVETKVGRPHVWKPEVIEDAPEPETPDLPPAA